jgi:hypothetical protein
VIATTVDESGTRRAVTKLVEGERFVSCTCCTTAECCMYPAQGLLDGDYTAADLPDSVLIFGTDTYTKNGSTYESGNSTLEAVIFPEGTNGRWAFFLDGDEIGDRGQPCLIAPDDAQAVTDFFEDTYEVNFLTDKTVTVTRESLCSWFGQQTIDGFVYEASLAYNDATYSWEAGFSTQDVGSSLNTKDGDQNTPVGSYPGDYAITVSAP